MQKMLRRSASLLFILTLAAAIVIPTVAEPVSDAMGDQSSSGTAEDVPLADDYELSADLDVAGEPDGEDLVKVIVKVDAPSLLDYANEKGITVQEAMLRSEGIRTVKKIESLSESAKKALSPYLVETGFSYSTVLGGFSATIRYEDLSRLEQDARVEKVILSDTYEVPQAITENDVNVDGSTGIYDSSVVDYDGTGTVVAVLDTGTDYTHEVFDMVLDDTKTAITKDDVAGLSAELAATSLSAANGESINEDDLYLSTKLPYAYDYADGDANVYPSEAHGTHVAGIIAGKSDRITGVAPSAQIATFKVFSDYDDGAETDAILAALNDAVLLGVDAINMSLGSSCGFTREEDGSAINDVYDSVEAAGICLVVAASNDYSSAYGSANGNTNLASNPDSGTVGSPASYSASLAVASISGVKTPYFLLGDGTEIYFRESRRIGQEEDNDFVGGMLGDEHDGTFDFVVIPGVGYEANYTGIDVNGKIAVVRRGGNSFEQKVSIAQSMGAVGVIIYNNVSGMLSMSVGTGQYIPSCLISMDYGEILVAQGSGTISLSKDYLAGPFMSDFSSWGVLPNLTLAPDITAHGGEITSSYPGGNEYDTISGTSMAAPNLAGALILVRQYVKDMDPTLTTSEVRDLSYSLMMSTATIANNEYGNPYSPRKQGAGLADILKSVTTKAYLTVDGSNKPKLSLGDDPNRSGVYELEFNITNLAGEALSYQLDPIVFTESMSSDDRTVAELAYLLDADYSYSVSSTQGSVSLSGDTISLGGYSTAKINVTVTLSQEAKDYIDSNFVNGMYVEGYVRLNSLNEDGIGLNLPYLAFYGNWADAPMLDVSEYEVGASQEDSSVLEEDKLVADVYATLPMAGFASTDDNGNDTVGYWGMGAYGYILPQGYSMPVTVERHASLTSSEDGTYMLYSISAGLLRGAKRIEMQIADSTTGEVIWTKTGYNGRKSSSSGGEQTGGYILVEFDVRELGLANNSVYTFSMECFLDWGDGNQGNNNTFSFDFTIDNEKPVMLDTYVRSENNRKTVEFNIYDNHYLQGLAVYTYESLDKNGNPVGLTSITDGVVPVYDGEFNSSTRVSLDVTSHWSLIQENGGKLYVQVMDYARNSTTAFVQLEQNDDLQLSKTRDARDNYSIDINGQVDLSEYVRTYANVEGEYLENYWTTDLVWESADPEIATVGNGEISGGLVTGIATGSTQITVRPKNGSSEDALSFNVTVTENETTLRVTGITLSDYAVQLERGESTTVHLTVEPYNLSPEQLQSLEFVWASSSANATVEPGTVAGHEGDMTYATITAKQSGSATVSVRVNGTYVNASCSVNVLEEFYVDGVYLRSYTGRGDENGVVEIPDDLGVSYIYPNAFFNNPYITEIIIPEGVMYIMRAGIYGCENLVRVQLPSTLEEIQTFGLAWNPSLKEVDGLNHVSVIGSRAFIYDTALEEVDLSRTTYIKNMAFYGCESLKSVNLSKVGMVDEAAFAYCTGLTDLVIPANTTLENSAFAYCTSLENVVIYSKNIGIGAFASCTSLESVTFAGDVDTIDVQAFYGCSVLSDVKFLGSVYKIGDLAFYGCSSLTSFTIPAGLEILGAQPFLGTNIASVTISKDARITQTGLAAFHGMPVVSYTVEAGNKYFTSDSNGILYDKTMYKLVAFPAGKSLAGMIFTVPDSVRVIGANAFVGTSGATSDGGLNDFRIDLNNVEIIEENAFFGFGNMGFSSSQQNPNTQQIVSVGQLTGYDNVRIIGDGAFEQSYLTTLPVSDKTTYIGDYAFANMSLLGGEIVLPDSLTHLGEGAFMYNGYVSLRNSATGESYYVTLDEYAESLSSDETTVVNPYSAITSVTIGANLREAGEGAFTYCADLASVNFGAMTEISNSMFAYCENLSDVSLPDTVTAIGSMAFAGCTALDTLKLPGNEAFTAIGDGAFMGTALTSVTLPSSVTTIGASAFENVPLTFVDLSGVTAVGARAFYGTRLVSVESENVLTVGGEAFAANSQLLLVSLPNAAAVEARAFADCDGLETVYLPKAQTIGDGAFSGCSALTDLNVMAAETVGASAFAGTSALAQINLPNVQSIGAHAFSGSSVTGLSLSAALSSVAEQAFAGAESLASIAVDAANTLYLSENGVLYRRTGTNDYVSLVAYPEGKQDAEFSLDQENTSLRVIRIGAYAFADNKHLQSVTLPVFLRVVGAAAFYGCDNLTRIEFLSATAPTLESYAYTQADGTSDNVYNNFKTALGDPGERNLTIVVPSNHTGYDLYIWEQYLGEVGAEDGIEVSETARPIHTAIDFMDRVRNLPSPENITEADREEITMLQRIFNTLVATQRSFVTGGFDGTNYSEILTAAAAALPEVPEDPGDNTPDVPTEPSQPEGPNVGLIVGLSVGGAVVLAGVAVAVVFIVRKKRRG